MILKLEQTNPQTQTPSHRTLDPPWDSTKNTQGVPKTVFIGWAEGKDPNEATTLSWDLKASFVTPNQIVNSKHCYR